VHTGQAGSRSKAQGAIRSGGVTVNGRVALKASATLATGDCVQAVLEPAPLLQVSYLISSMAKTVVVDVYTVYVQDFKQGNHHANSHVWCK